MKTIGFHFWRIGLYLYLQILLEIQTDLFNPRFDGSSG